MRQSAASPRGGRSVLSTATPQRTPAAHPKRPDSTFALSNVSDVPPASSLSYLTPVTHHQAAPSSATPACLLPSRESELQQQLTYTQDVLAKYKSYVETRIMEQLRQTQRVSEALQADVQRMQKEKEALVHQLSVKSSELDRIQAREAAAAEAHTKEMHQLSAATATQVSAIERRHAAEVTDLRAALEDLKKSGTQQTVLQATLAKRDDEVKKLRQTIAEHSARLTRVNGDTVAGSEALSVVEEMSSATQDFYKTVCTAALQHLQNTTVMGSELPVSCPSLPVIPALGGAAGQSATAVAHTLKAFSEQLDFAQREVVGVVKLLLTAHATVVDKFEQCVCDLEKERDLSMRRMEELEHDRSAERQMFEQRLSESRLKGVLLQSPTHHLAQLTVSRQPGDAGGHVDVASILAAVEQSGNQSSPKRVRRVPVGVQTALDVAVFSTTANSIGSAQGSGSTAQGSGMIGTTTYNRVLHEVSRLQSENSQLRESVILLDSQRQRFLGFVNNESITAFIQSSLEGSMLDAATEW